MTVNFWLAVSVLGGAVAGYGIYLLIVQFRPATPALGPALRRLHPAPVGAVDPAPPVIARVPASSFKLTDLIRARAADLEIIGRSERDHALAITASALLGMIVPALATLVVVVLRLDVSLAIPIFVTLAFAALAGWLAHRDVVTKAKAARVEFVRALCTYATLTAHQVRSGHGAVEAMERAAGICHGWPYARLRGALLTAQLQMNPPWDEMRALAARIEVGELATFADIMRSAGTDGAQVYSTLRAQAESLRDHIRVRAVERAKTRTSHLDIPTTMLIMILLTLLIYPLMAGLFHQA
ncbi:MAG: secretion system protein [Catenulispora sp.]|nr:secretion system protein [Catenulispora sp.]